MLCKYSPYYDQGGGSPHGLTQILWFNSRHALFSPLTPIINTNKLSLKKKNEHYSI